VLAAKNNQCKGKGTKIKQNKSRVNAAHTKTTQMACKRKAEVSF